MTIDEIRRVGQPPEKLKMAHPYGKHVLRKVTPYFTKFFIEHNVSPNQISLLSIAFDIVGNLLLVFGDYHLMLLGSLFYHFWHLFDCVDGEIARVTKRKTYGGAYLENITYMISECGFILCLGIGLSRMFNNDIFVLWGLTFAFFSSLLQAFALSRDIVLAQVEAEEEIVITTRMSLAKRLYKKARLLFVVFSGYVVLTVIVLIELIFSSFLPFSSMLGHEFLGERFTILSLYFFLYGFTWIVRTIVSSVTNYRYLMKS